MDIKKVVVCGGGVLGSQIAFQAQYAGFDTTIWLRSEGSITRTRPKLDTIKANYLKALKKMNETHAHEDFCRGLTKSYDTFDYQECVIKTNHAYDNLKLELDLEKAVSDADLVIEAMTEDFHAKEDMFKQLAPLLPEKTILCTNSSSILPSKFTHYTGRPHKFLALHFANDIYRNNTAEVMATKDTDMEIFNEVVDFAWKMHMVPLQLKKEQAGYLLNSMLIPFLGASMDLLVNEISSVEDIDAAWTLGTGAPMGPFEILDIIGINTAYEIVKPLAKVPRMLVPYNFKGQAKLLGEMVSEGKLGKSTGVGFYEYDEEGKILKKTLK